VLGFVGGVELFLISATAPFAARRAGLDRSRSHGRGGHEISAFRGREPLGGHRLFGLRAHRPRRRRGVPIGTRRRGRFPV